MEYHIFHDKTLNITNIPPQTLVLLVPYMELRQFQMLMSAIRYPDREREIIRTRLITDIEMVLIANTPPPEGEQ